MFLSGVNSAYSNFADVIYRGQFTCQAELTAAERKDLEDMGIPKGAAGLIIASARDKGETFIALQQPFMVCTPILYCLTGLEDTASESAFSFMLSSIL